MQDIYQEIAKQSKLLMLKEPFYGLFLISLNKELRSNVETACVTPDKLNIKLCINPEFWLSLDKKTKLAILKHELLHIVFFHLDNFERFPNKRLYNDVHVSKIIEIYNKYIIEFLNIDNEEQLNAYVMEKEKPTLVKEEEDGYEIYKDGVHILYPNLCTTPRVQYILRASILSKLSENNIFSDINPINTLDDIFDKLDNVRVEKLMQMVSNHTFGQVMVTDTDSKRVKDIFDAIHEPFRLFTVEAGRIEQLELHEEV
jgi:hypothetical protein